MKLIVTARELFERGLWEKYCEMFSVSVYAVSEGHIDMSTEFIVTIDQARELGIRILKQQ